MMLTPVHQNLVQVRFLAAWSREEAPWAALRYLEQQEQAFVVEGQVRLDTYRRQTGFVLVEKVGEGGTGR